MSGRPAVPLATSRRRHGARRRAVRRRLRWLSASGAITRRDACAAISRLAALTAAGVSTGDAIASSAKSAARASGTAGSRLLGDLYRAVHRGTSLSAAMGAQGMPFTEAEIAVVRAGERGGSTPHALALLGERMEREAGGRRRIASALAYPCILFAGALGALCFLSLVVLPSFTTLYSGHELPFATRTLLEFGSAVRAWGAPVMLVVFGSVAALVATRRKSAAFARVCDRIAVDAPFFRTLALPRAAHETCALLAVLLDSGCEAEEALILASRAAPNRVVAARIGDALRALRHGVPLSVAWTGASLDGSGDAAPLLEIAEATGSYAEAFRRLATLEGTAAERALARICRLAEPVAVIAMAIAVGGGVLAVYQPMLGSASLLLGGTP
ncbi:MAG TPA: type II secretion system F family protein [Candidatus Limnocylindrales bacterium]|nr:type II secretion system F family protein [Candidatus Limnocylindrales bacterium]